MEKNKYKFQSQQLVSIVDFVKWTTTLGDSALSQMETPITGFSLSPGISRLFALGKDQSGWCLTMDSSEGGWLTDLPLTAALIGFDDQLILVTEPVKFFEAIEISPLGIGIFIPHLHLRELLMRESNGLLGFALTSANGPERVNKIIPLYTPETYKQALVSKNIKPGLLSAI